MSEEYVKEHVIMDSNQQILNLGYFVVTFNCINIIGNIFNPNLKQV